MLDLLLPEKEIHLVDYEPYHRLSVKPRGFKEFCNMYDQKEGGAAGLWEVVQLDAKTGDPKIRVWSNKVLTDKGATNILESAISNAVPSAVFNNLYINNNDGSTTLTTALTNGQTSVTSLAVAALPAAIPSGSQIQLGYGTGQTQTVTTSALANQGATSISVTSFTANAAYAIGAAVVPVPQVTDNPSNANLKANQSSVVEQYSGNLSSGAFSTDSTTGAGNRSRTVVFLFRNSVNGGSTPNGDYTSLWLVNVSSAAGVNNYIDHLVNTKMRVDNSNNVNATCTIKI